MEGFNFTKKLFGEIIPTVAKQAYTGLTGGVKSFFAKDARGRAETIKGGVAAIGTKVIPTVVTETIAGLETLGKSVLEPIAGKERVKDIGIDPSGGGFYGRKTISLQDAYRRSKSYVGDLGGNKYEQIVYPILGTAGYAYIESPIGAPGKSIKLSKTLAKDLIKETDEKVVKTILRANYPEFTDSAINRISKKVATAKTENEIYKSFGGSLKLVSDDTVEPTTRSFTSVGEVDTVANQLSDTKYKLDTEITPAPKISSAVDDRTFGYNIARNVNETQEIFHPLAKTDANWTDFPTWRDDLSSSYVSAREYLQDDWFRMKKISKEMNIDLTDVNNPYLYETLFHGRVGGKIEQFADWQDSYFNELSKVAKTAKVDNAKFADEISEYMLALHAPERNAVLGDGAAGITTAEAKAIADDLAKKPYFENIKKLADDMIDMNRETLKVLREGNVISDELYTKLVKTYKNHVPLYRIMDDGLDDLSGLANKAFDVKTSGVRKAVGSNREVADIFSNIISNYENAIVRSEKNVVGQSILKFAKDNPKLDMFEIVKPRAIGKGFDGKTLYESATKFTQDPQVLTVFDAGKPVYLKIKDKSLAAMFKGVNRQKVGSFMRLTATMSRLFSGLQTRFNPSFALPNKIRDIQEVLVYMDAETKGLVRARDILKYEGKTSKAVIDFIRGNKDTKLAKLYKEMIDEGGTTGGFALSTRKQIEIDWKKSLKDSTNKPKEFAKNVIKVVDNMNRVFEDSTRLSVYAAAKDRGLDKKTAAFLAKNASVNFNKMGTAAPVINALYVFLNASIQGSAKMIRAMKNPKTAAKVVGAVSLATLALNEYNNRIDPDWKNKVTKWDRLNGLTVMVPSDEGVKYFTIPVGWGIKPIKAMVDSASDMYDGQLSLTGAADNIMTSIIEAYNPIGGSDLLSAITPTFVGPIPTDLISELYRNRAWHGGKIKPDWDQYAPPSVQYFSDIEDTALGRTAVAVSSGLSGIGIEVSPEDIDYAISSAGGGAGRFGSQLIDLFKTIGGEKIKPSDAPILSRFIRERTEEEVGQGTHDYQKLEEYLTSQSKERTTLKNRAEKTLKQMEAMPKQEASKLFDSLLKTDVELAKKIIDVRNEKSLGLSYTQRKILELNVKNGSRAQYLSTVFGKLKTKEEKAALWNEYVSKKIITPEVAKQLVKLLK